MFPKKVRVSGGRLGNLGFTIEQPVNRSKKVICRERGKDEKDKEENVGAYAYSCAYAYRIIRL